MHSSYLSDYLCCVIGSAGELALATAVEVTLKETGIEESQEGSG